MDRPFGFAELPDRIVPFARRIRNLNLSAETDLGNARRGFGDPPAMSVSMNEELIKRRFEVDCPMGLGYAELWKDASNRSLESSHVPFLTTNGG
jgi:hypothetical protein